MAVLRTLISLAATALLIQVAMAANYTVGGTSGWTLSSDLKTWASSQSFLVGDNLIFQYGPSHNVLEVSKGDYDSCQPSNAVQSYTDGNTVIPLSSPGKRYFICGVSGHCDQGMKLDIDTLATASPPSTSPSTPPPSSPAAPAPQASPPLTPAPASPAPEISAPSPVESPISTPSPVESPKPASPESPVSPVSQSSPPSSSPPPSPDVPSAEPPSTSPPPGVSLPPPPSSSSATKGVFKTTLTMGFCFGIMMLLAF